MKIIQLKIIHRFISIYFILILPINLLFGAFESSSISTANLALGRINMSSKGNLIDIMNEPSSIINFGLSGGEVIWNRPFQISELQQTALAAGFRYKSWGFGLSASTFGNNIYNESILSLSIARAVKEKLSIGVNISLYQLKITEYGTAHAPGLSTSFRYNINADWDWVTTIRNINNPKIGSTKEALPQVMTSGFVGEVHDIITIATEWEQDLEYEGAIKFGVMVKPLKQITFSGGYVSNPGQLTAGLSININKIYFEYGTIAYNDLGLFTHQLGIGVNFNRH